MTAQWTNEELIDIAENGETEKERELARELLEARGVTTDDDGR